MPSAAVVLSGQARSPGAARQFLADTLTTWAAPQYEETGQLLISELVTNAVLHARTEITVRIELDPTRLRLEVTDASTRQPITRHYSMEATTGRGLAMIDALARRWGVDRHDGGKTVWAELTTDQRQHRQRPDIEVDLALFPDLEGNAGEPGQSPGRPADHEPTMLSRAA